MNKPNRGFYWHVHHDKLMEYCYDYDERVWVITFNKPQNEVETRLRLFKLVKGDLPKKLVEAGEKYNKTREKFSKVWGKCHEGEKKYDEAREKYEKACWKYDRARKEYKDFITDLHAKECGCKEWDGKRIMFVKGV